MANPTITTCHSAPSCIIKDALYRQETLLFSAADTWAQNTILARKLVSDTITAAITGTGVWTLAAAADAYRTLQVGAYVITAGTLSSGIGAWTAVAPDGQHETFTSTAADDDLEFPNLGFTITVTAPGGGATNFATADVVTMTTAAQTGTPLVLFDIDGVNGAQVPVAILPYEVIATAGGSVAADALFAGVVIKEKLIIDADGSSTNVSDHVMDQLAQAGFTVQNVTNVSILDNGAS
jgi:hypothetical protein